MEEVLKKIKPSKAEQQKFRITTADFLKKLNSKLKDARAILGGSGAKKTGLAGSHDIDIYVLFSYQKFKQKSSELANFLEPALNKAFPKQEIARVHGSRDYFQFKYKEHYFEVVPIIKISQASKAINITDVSPLHTAWVNKKGKKIKEEILLTKQFCKANRVYGAESHLGGLSGYVAEILTVHYGSFKKLLQAAQNWRNKEVIDTERHYPKKDVLFQLNKSKLLSPLIVIDPVDKSRNAAAALTLEKFLQFKNTAKKFLQKPAAEFFEKKKLSFEKIKKEALKRKQNLIFLAFHPLPGRDDVVGGKIVKIFAFLEKKLAPFSVVKSGWEWDAGKEALIYVFTEKRELPKTETRLGPPLKMKEFVQDFKKKHPGAKNKNGRITAEIKVKYPQLEKLLPALLKEQYITEKIKKINQIKIV